MAMAESGPPSEKREGKPLIELRVGVGSYGSGMQSGMDLMGQALENASKD